MFPQFDPDMLARLLRGQTQVDAPSPVQLDPTAAGPPQPIAAGPIPPDVPPLQIGPAEAKAMGNQAAPPAMPQPVSTGPAGGGTPFAGMNPVAPPGNAMLPPGFDPSLLGQQQPAPFQPRTIDVGAGMGAIGLPRQVNSRDEELMAMQEQAFNRARANAVGTGWYSTGVPVDPHLGVQAGNAAANSFLQASIGSEDARTRMDLANTSGRFGLQNQLLQNQGLLDAANAKAHADHAMGLNQATIGLLGALAQNPNMDPASLETAWRFLNSQRGATPGAVGSPLDSANKGLAGAPDAAGPLDPLQAAKDLSTKNQVLAPFHGDFLNPETGKATAATPDTVTKLVDRLQQTPLTPEQRTQLMADIRGGKYGDPTQFMNSLYQVAAKNYLMSVGPSRPGSPTDLSRTDMGVPFGDDPNALFTLRRQPAGNAAGRLLEAGGGVMTGSPFNQIVTPGGQVIPLEGGLNPGGANDVLGLNAAGRRQAPGRTSHSAQLLRDLIKLTESQPK